jgi:hypothetical protein
MAVREKANQSSATNIYKQFALAFHNHNDTAGHLPNRGHTDWEKLKDINFGWHNANFRDSGHGRPWSVRSRISPSTPSTTTFRGKLKPAICPHSLLPRVVASQSQI